MAVLLDTNALIWALEGDPALGPAAARAIEQASADDAASVSAISFWEVAVNVAKGRLRLDVPVEEWRARALHAGLVEIPVDGAICVAADGLRDLHPDPADRLIVATALREGATLVTSDGKLLGWPGALSRLDARV